MVVTAVETTRASRPTRSAAAAVTPSTQRRVVVPAAAGVAIWLIWPTPMRVRECVVDMDTGRGPKWSRGGRHRQVRGSARLFRRLTSCCWSAPGRLICTIGRSPRAPNRLMPKPRREPWKAVVGGRRQKRDLCFRSSAESMCDFVGDLEVLASQRRPLSRTSALRVSVPCTSNHSRTGRARSSADPCVPHAAT